LLRVATAENPTVRRSTVNVSRLELHAVLSATAANAKMMNNLDLKQSSSHQASSLK
jgi:hypothetical protein